MVSKKEKTFPIVILLTLACLVALLWLLIDTPVPVQPARDGKMDMSDWNGETIMLSGQWDFYWNRFLDKYDLSQNPLPDLKAEVPSVWNNFVVNGREVGGMGFATYRLHMTGVKAGTPLALRVIPFSTAYELYIDDELAASSGKISTSADGFVPQYTIQTVIFEPDRDEFDIILHVSNFTYARGGAWYAIYFGNPEKVARISQDIFARDNLVTIGLLLLSAASVFLLILRRDRGYLLFICLCFVFLLRTIIDGSYLIYYLFPSVSFRTVICIDYISLYWLPVLCVALFRYIYPENLSLIYLKLLILYATVITVLTLALPISIFTQYIYLAELVAAVTCIYGVMKMLLLTLKRNREAYFIFTGGSALTLCVFHDLLCENNLIVAGYVELSPMGFLALAIFLQCMFWVRYDRSNKENERMLIELNKADERERKLELQFLKSQIRPHFINNALNAVISISRTDSEKSRKLLIEFSKYLQSCYGVENLDNKIPIENELSFVRAYVALEQARFSESLFVDYDIDSIFLMIPPLTLQPLVENAIIHGVKEKDGDGHVLIYVKDCGDFAKVGASDDGVGIDPEYAAALLSNEHIGTGVGIHNINRRMKRLYNTELHLENRPGGGTDAYFVIPKEGETCCEP